MTIQRKIERVKAEAGMVSRTAETIPSWVPPVFKKFYDFSRKWAEAFNRNLLHDRKDEMIKEAAKHIVRYM